MSRFLHIVFVFSLIVALVFVVNRDIPGGEPNPVSTTVQTDQPHDDFVFTEFDLSDDEELYDPPSVFEILMRPPLTEKDFGEHIVIDRSPGLVFGGHPSKETMAKAQ